MAWDDLKLARREYDARRGTMSTGDAVTIADVAFDAPVPHPFSYRVRPAPTVAARPARARPAEGARRVGVVLAVRDGDDRGLKALPARGDAAPCSRSSRSIWRWIASESCRRSDRRAPRCCRPRDERAARGADVRRPRDASADADRRRAGS